VFSNQIGVWKREVQLQPLLSKLTSDGEVRIRFLLSLSEVFSRVSSSWCKRPPLSAWHLPTAVSDSMNVQALKPLVAILLLCLTALNVRCLDDADLKVNEA